MPAIVRPLIVRMVRKRVKNRLFAQGLGRHSRSERLQLADRATMAVAQVLGDNKYIAGDTKSGADAAVFAMLEAMRCPVFNSGLVEMVNRHDNLVAYCEAMKSRWFAG